MKMKPVEPISRPEECAPVDDIGAILKLQKESFLKEGAVSAEVRIDRMQRTIDGLIKYKDDIADAVNQDFNGRSKDMNMLFEVAGSVATLKHAIKNVKTWMRPEKRKTIFPLNLLGGALK
ncbi:aldehyde dehydrogenase family protein [Kineobactrum salinum]|uniref:hypothetical protein n=1 Tax=Kineobactrum salinum TaxID=2708301 RepID=UPI001E3002E7|nr:hypothetical protein [Kineobactrum salinum]